MFQTTLFDTSIQNPIKRSGKYSYQTGDRFGELVFTGVEKRDGRKSLLELKCDCGEITWQTIYALQYGKTSCGRGKGVHWSWDHRHENGTVFGYLTLTGRSEKRKTSTRNWSYF